MHIAQSGICPAIEIGVDNRSAKVWNLACWELKVDGVEVGGRGVRFLDWVRGWGVGRYVSSLIPGWMIDLLVFAG